jgi:hypothetical protein
MAEDIENRILALGKRLDMIIESTSTKINALEIEIKRLKLLAEQERSDSLAINSAKSVCR